MSICFQVGSTLKDGMFAIDSSLVENLAISFAFETFCMGLYQGGCRPSGRPGSIILSNFDYAGHAAGQPRGMASICVTDTFKDITYDNIYYVFYNTQHNT